MFRRSLAHLGVTLAAGLVVPAPLAQNPELPTQVDVPGVVDVKWIA
jgi:hypothetical protein